MVVSSLDTAASDGRPLAMIVAVCDDDLSGWVLQQESRPTLRRNALDGLDQRAGNGNAVARADRAHRVLGVARGEHGLAAGGRRL